MGISNTGNLNKSYGRDSGTVRLATYTNDTGSDVYVYELTLTAGSAQGSNFGPEGTLDGHGGDGSPITIDVSAGSSSASDTTYTVLPFSSGGYPDKSNATAVTFIFDSAPYVAAGSSIDFIWTNRSSLTDSTSSGQILTFGSYADASTDSPSPPDPPVIYYDVTYNPNGGSPTPSTQTGQYGTVVTLADAPSYTGYEFIHWQASDGSTYSAGDSYTITEDTTMTAQWRRLQSRVTFDLNSVYASGGPSPNYRDVNYGDTLEIPEPLPTNAVQIFRGWATTSGYVAGEHLYNVGDVFDPQSQNATLYARWYYRLTFFYNEGSWSGTAPDPVPIGSPITIPTEIPIKPSTALNDFEFTNWYDTRTGVQTKNYNPGDTFTDILNVILLALWEEYATVTFDATTNGGVVTGDITQRYSADEKFLLRTTTPPEYDITFIPNNGATIPTITKTSTSNGWFSAAKGGPFWGAENVTSNFPAGTNRTIYTQYTNPSFVYATDLPTVTRDGYNFIGWYYLDSMGAKHWVTSDFEVTSNLTIIAVWESKFRRSLKDYMSITDGIVIQSGTWKEAPTAMQPPKMEFIVDITENPTLRIQFADEVKEGFWVQLTGFTDRGIIAGLSKYASSDDVPDETKEFSTNPNSPMASPQDGDFLGPGKFPWASKVSFNTPTIYHTEIISELAENL